MNYTTVHIGVTLVMMTSLIALIVWAWSSARRATFEQAARAPLEQDRSTTDPTIFIAGIGHE